MLSFRYPNPSPTGRTTQYKGGNQNDQKDHRVVHGFGDGSGHDGLHDHRDACGLPRRDRRNRGNARGDHGRSARRLRRRPDAGLLRVRQPGRQRPHGCPERDQCLHRAADRCAYRVPDHLLRRLEPEGPDGPPVRREGRHLLHRRLAELRPLHFSGPVHPPQR